ncbi:MAG TPA: hypothetical protein H9887_01570 [Candidatus Dorea intestinavium]|nr:hypothetical protein [Candidatus Dorea intestinavium]
MSDFFEKRHNLELFNGELMAYEELRKVFQNYVIFRTSADEILFGYCSDLYLYAGKSSFSGLKIKLPQYDIEQDFLLRNLISIKAVSMKELLALND